MAGTTHAAPLSSISQDRNAENNLVRTLTDHAGDLPAFDAEGVPQYTLQCHAAPPLYAWFRELQRTGAAACRLSGRRAGRWQPLRPPEAMESRAARRAEPKAPLDAGAQGAETATQAGPFPSLPADLCAHQRSATHYYVTRAVLSRLRPVTALLASPAHRFPSRYMG